jgi:hypothetical protein
LGEDVWAELVEVPKGSKNMSKMSYTIGTKVQEVPKSGEYMGLKKKKQKEKKYSKKNVSAQCLPRSNASTFALFSVSDWFMGNR